MPQLSIVTPFFNTPTSYFESCASSILNQPFDDFEWIVVDDGSDSSFAQWLDDFAQSDKRITLIHTSNGGVSSARNTGIRASTGSFITFVDSDDTVTNQFFQEAINLLETTGADIAWGVIQHVRTTREDSLPKNLRRGLIEGMELRQLIRIATAGEDLHDFDGVKDYGVYTIAPKIYRAHTIEGLLFDESMKLGEDSLFNLEALTRASAVLLWPAHWYRYQIRDSSASQSRTSPDGIIDALTSFDTYATRALALGVPQGDVGLRVVHGFLNYLNPFIAEQGLKKSIHLSQGFSSLECCKAIEYQSLNDFDVSHWMRFVVRCIATQRHSTLACGAYCRNAIKRVHL